MTIETTIETEHKDEEYSSEAGPSGLATAVLERWLLDAKSSHLWDLDNMTEDAKMWCEIAGIKYETFLTMLARAKDVGRNKDDSGQTYTAWTRHLIKQGKKVKSSDYRKWCIENGLKPVEDSHRISEIMFVSGVMGLNLFDTKERSKA